MLGSCVYLMKTHTFNRLILCHAHTLARARTCAETQTRARAHTPLALLCKVAIRKFNNKPKRDEKTTSANNISTAWPVVTEKLLILCYNFSPIEKQPLTYMRAHTHPSLPVIVEENTSSLLYCVCVIDCLTPAVAAPAWCRLRRCPGCESPGSRRGSVRSPPCSRQQRSLILGCRSVALPLCRSAAPLSSPAASTSSHQGYSSRSHRAPDRRGARRAAERTKRHFPYPNAPFQSIKVKVKRSLLEIFLNRRSTLRCGSLFKRSHLTLNTPVEEWTRSPSRWEKKTMERFSEQWLVTVRLWREIKKVKQEWVREDQAMFVCVFVVLKTRYRVI